MSDPAAAPTALPPGTTDPWLFELKVVGGAGAFVATGGLLYRVGQEA